jgi:hypothetical protein
MSTFENSQLFMEPTTQQYGNHMVMTNVHKPNKTKYINIDTKFRDDYDYKQPASYQIILPERLNEIRSLKVTNVEIPISFYNISNNMGNNYFKITNGSTVTVIKVDDNQYNDETTLVNELNTLLTSHNVAINTTIHNKCTITADSNITVDFAVDKDGNPDKFNFKNKLGWCMGFRNLSYNLTAGTPITSECNINISGNRYLYLAIDEFNKGNQNSFVTPLSSSMINKNIISRIATDFNTYPYKSIHPANPSTGLLSDTRSYTGKIDLQKIQVSLLNEVGIPIELNGQDFSFCIEAICE